MQSRREFLKFVSSQSTLLGISPWLIQGLSGCTSTPSLKAFPGIDPSREDQLLLADGLQYKVLMRWGDRINKQGETFGFNNDFTCFLPLDGKSNEGLLWVNHESVIPQFIHNKSRDQLTRSINEIIKEQEAVGGSILHIKKMQNDWVFQKDSPYNRRIHGRTKIPFSNDSIIEGSQFAVGTLANCAGGLTPWNTFLTSEENYDNFYGEGKWIGGKRVLDTSADKYLWLKSFPLPPEHYGWIVEIDPFTGKAEKQVTLGRAPHEGATVVATSDNRAVVYMGEDREGGYIYKFVSEGMDFKKGTLYAADTLKGRWLALDLDKSPVLKKIFKTQLQVLTYAHQSAEAVGATPQDRPEDVEVHPHTGEVFISLTKNDKRNNLYGSLLKIKESGNHTSENFEASTWISGGLDSGVACPDNLCFDKKGNLWVTNDMGEKDMGKKEYAGFGNNGLFYVPMSGPGAGIPIQVASAPTDAELTGPWFSPDYKTLFLSVQHPGSQSAKNLSQPTSTWPDGPGQLPKSAVVALQGPLFEKLMG